ncbi:MAG: hypothetical protein LIO97_13550 [Tannerellaceae bacterium]|nr:hypothetical protein [Tannerellaceae bacterium]
MTGQTLLPGELTAHTSLSLSLMRSVARVDVTLSKAAQHLFTLQTVQVYRINSLVQLIPDEETTGAVTALSIPSGNTVKENKTAVFETGGQELSARLYIPESEAVAGAGNNRTQATCVIVGGTYQGDTQPTYYRMDFLPGEGAAHDELFGQVLRNHKYVFEIQNVLGTGWDTPGEAATNDATLVAVSVREWNENTTWMDFDGAHFFGLSTRQTTLSFYSASMAEIHVGTDLPAYQVNWLDEAGNLLPEGIARGGSMEDSGHLFKVRISPDGSLITVTNLQSNNTEAAYTRQLLITAGNMKLTVTITQSSFRQESRYIYVYGSTLEIGTWGNGIYGSNTPLQRAGGLVELAKKTAVTSGNTVR